MLSLLRSCILLLIPDYVGISSKGIAELPKYEVYLRLWKRIIWVIMTGEIQPSFMMWLLTMLFVKKWLILLPRSCHFIVTMGGIPITEDKVKFYVALLRQVGKLNLWRKGGFIAKADRGRNRLTLAMAKERNLRRKLVGTTTGLKLIEKLGFWFSSFWWSHRKEIKEGLGETLHQKNKYSGVPVDWNRKHERRSTYSKFTKLLSSYINAFIFVWSNICSISNGQS